MIVQRKFKWILVAVFSATGVMAIAFGEKSSAAEPIESAEASRTLYRQHCASCHGNDGKSNTKKGRETEASDLTDPGVKGNGDAKNIRIITNGKGEMPGFKGKLSSGQIASIARYIKAL